MDGNPSLQNGGTWLPLSRTMPEYLNSGDLIDQHTLLLRAKKGENDDISPKLPSNPFSIGLSVRNLLGSDPTKLMVAVKEAKGAHYVIRTTSKMVVESLLKLDELTDGTKIEVIPHPNLNIVQGIIYDTDTINIEAEEILIELSEQNVIQVRRITKMSNGVRPIHLCWSLLFRDHIYLLMFTSAWSVLVCDSITLHHFNALTAAVSDTVAKIAINLGLYV